MSKFVSLFCCAISIAALSLFIMAHATRSDSLMMATVFPMALWLLGGLIVSLPIRRMPRIRLSLILAWLAASCFLGDAPQSLLRSFNGANPQWEAARTDGTAIRVISLNCLSQIAAVEELMAWQPDVILTQESPSSAAFQRLIDSKYNDYSLVWSQDAAMLVRGTATVYPVPHDLTSEYVLAEVKLSNGARFNIGSVRLMPSVLHFDVWNSRSWQSYAHNRQLRRKQLTDIFKVIQPQVEGSPAIFGGDFNAPARDAIFQLLQPTLRDAWPEAGRGWGKTIINSAPVHRIDQIWISPHFRAESVISQKSSYSDHRMVICDLWFE